MKGINRNIDKERWKDGDPESKGLIRYLLRVRETEKERGRETFGSMKEIGRENSDLEI